MNTIYVLAPLTILAAFAICAVTAVRIARLRAIHPESPSPDVTARLEELERGLQGVQHELAETQERLDFAERLLSRGREEGRING